jgi:TnpA family transposase
MIKYATAIRLGTASTEAILRRFTKDVTHPAYAAMLETGRAQRTIFLARWLRDRDLQRETSSGLNVVENYNGVNDYICPPPLRVAMGVGAGAVDGVVSV